MLLYARKLRAKGEFLAERVRTRSERRVVFRVGRRNGLESWLVSTGIGRNDSIDGRKRLEYLKVRPCAGLRSINAPVSNYFVMIIVTCPATMRPDPIPIISNERFDQKLSMVRRWNNIYLKLHPARPPYPLFIAEPID